MDKTDTYVRPNASSDSRPNPPVDFLILGHLAKDVENAGATNYALGGVVNYAAVTAHRLGRKPTMVTRAADGIDLTALPDTVDVRLLPSPTTTTFVNLYSDEGRIQYCYTPARPICANDVPDALRRPRIALLGPIMDELEADVAPIFGDDTLVAAVPQGWLRSRDGDGRVHSKPWTCAPVVLPHLDVLVLSEEDLEHDSSRLEPFLEHVPIVILTRNHAGCTVFRRVDGDVESFEVAPRPAAEVDPTGAGDIFAAAFLVRLQETSDVEHAARFANVAASFGVEGYGVAGIPTRRQVLEYLEGEH